MNWLRRASDGGEPVEWRGQNKIRSRVDHPELLALSAWLDLLPRCERLPLSSSFLFLPSYLILSFVFPLGRGSSSRCIPASAPTDPALPGFSGVAMQSPLANSSSMSANGSENVRVEVDVLVLGVVEFGAQGFRAGVGAPTLEQAGAEANADLSWVRGISSRAGPGGGEGREKFGVLS